VAECKVRLYDRNAGVVAEGVVTAPEPVFLVLDGALYQRLVTSAGDGYARYRWECELPTIEVTYHRGVDSYQKFG